MNAMPNMGFLYSRSGCQAPRTVSSALSRLAVLSSSVNLAQTVSDIDLGNRPREQSAERSVLGRFNL